MSSQTPLTRMLRTRWWWDIKLFSWKSSWRSDTYISMLNGVMKCQLNMVAPSNYLRKCWFINNPGNYLKTCDIYNHESWCEATKIFVWWQLSRCKVFFTVNTFVSSVYIQVNYKNFCNYERHGMIFFSQHNKFSRHNKSCVEVWNISCSM